eukprot:8440781-Pyramimonas_sp.AAC.1
MERLGAWYCDGIGSENSDGDPLGRSGVVVADHGYVDVGRRKPFGDGRLERSLCDVHSGSNPEGADVWSPVPRANVADVERGNLGFSLSNGSFDLVHRVVEVLGLHFGGGD